METKSGKPIKGYLLPLILGGILQALPTLSPGSRFLITVSALTWPFFFLLASRRAPSRKQFWLVMAVLGFSKFLRTMLLYGASPLYILGVLVISLLIALCETVAFGVDRILTRRDSPFSSLVFPLLFTGTTCLSQALSIGNLTDPGAALAYLPALAQIAGMVLEHGLCFILTWISSMLAIALDGPRRRRIVCLSVCVLLTVCLICFGLTCLSGRGEPNSSIRVAFCTSFDEDFDTVSSKRPAEEFIGLIDRELSEAAGQGAQLAVFAEEHTCLKADALFSSIDTISGLVRQYGIPTLLPIEVTMSEGIKNINEAILFDKTGTPVLTYVKSNLVPLVESAFYEKGQNPIGQAVIEIGGKNYTLGVLICFDSNNAAFVRKLDPDTEILLCPSWEWFSCNREQERTVILRAIENDVTVIKATQEGFHLASDPYGTIIFSESTEGKSATVTVADIPVYRKSADEVAPVLPSLNATSACELSSAVMVLILFVAMCFQLRNSDRKSRIYIACLFLTLLGLLFDAFSYIFDGSQWSNGLCFLVNLCSYIFVDVIMIAFAMYFHALLTERRGAHIRMVYASMLLPLLDIIFLIYAAASKRLFTVTNGLYAAGPWDTYSGFAPFFSILFVLIIAVMNRKKLNVREYSAIILYMVLPLGASFVVTFIGGVGSLSYVAVSLSMLILFVLIQAGTIEESSIRERILREMSLLDQLTSLGNRRAFDNRLAECSEFKPFAAVFCDLNGLKEANDTYGHAAGDELLLRFASLLKEHFDRQDIFRISGDEFVIIPSDPAPESLERIIDRFKKDIQLHNGIAAVGWAFGVGAEKAEIVKLAETRMYADKHRYHEMTGKPER